MERKMEMILLQAASMEYTRWSFCLIWSNSKLNGVGGVAKVYSPKMSGSYFSHSPEAANTVHEQVAKGGTFVDDLLLHFSPGPQCREESEVSTATGVSTKDEELVQWGYRDRGGK